MTTAFSTRLLSAGDAPTLRRMLDVFAEAFEDPESYRTRQPGDAYLTQLLASEQFVAIAALADGVVVGGLTGYVLRKFEQERSELYLYDIAVATPSRRQGVATALIEALRTVAAARGIGVIFVQAEADDEPAVALYGKLGRGQDVMHFDLLPPRSRA